MKTLNRPSLLLLIPLLSFSAVPVISAPAQQEKLDQSRAQEAERQERLGEERAEVVMPPPPSSDLPVDEIVRFHISHYYRNNVPGWGGSITAIGGIGGAIGLSTSGIISSEILASVSVGLSLTIGLTYYVGTIGG